MQNGIHFISGLPRSGSTLLAAILRQNPRFHAGMTSPVGAMYMALEGAMSRRNEAAVFIGDAQRRDVLKGLFTNYYDAIQEEKLVFDTNRVADRIHRFNLRRRPHEIRIASRTA